MMYIEYNNLYKEAESRGITPLDILVHCLYIADTILKEDTSVLI